MGAEGEEKGKECPMNGQMKGTEEKKNEGKMESMVCGRRRERERERERGRRKSTGTGKKKTGGGREKKGDQ